MRFRAKTRKVHARKRKQKKHTRRINPRRRHSGGIRFGTALATLGALGSAAASQPTNSGLVPRYEYLPSAQPLFPQSLASASMNGLKNAQAWTSPSAHAKPSFSSSLISINGMKNVQTTVQPSMFPLQSVVPTTYYTATPMPGPTALTKEEVQALANEAIKSVNVNKVLETRDSVAATISARKINDVHVIFPHNSATTSSRKILPGVPLTSRNQFLDISDCLKLLSEVHVMGFDIDMMKQRGELSSKHGNGLFTIFDSSPGDTKKILNEIFTAAANNPESIVIIRVENKRVSASDIEKVLSPEHLNRLYALKYGKEMPTVGEITSSGKNVLIFLQNADENVNNDTGLYPGGRIMSQDHFVYRTKWNKVDCFTQYTNTNECMITDNTKLLEGKPALLFMDLYSSVTGTNSAKLLPTIQAYTKILTEFVPAVVESAKSKNILVGNGVCGMYDMVTEKQLLMGTVFNHMGSELTKDVAVNILTNNTDVIITELIEKKITDEPALLDTVYQIFRDKKISPPQAWILAKTAISITCITTVIAVLIAAVKSVKSKKTTEQHF